VVTHSNRQDTRRLDGRVEVGDAYLGGRLPEGKSGRGSENKVSFLAAVQTTAAGHPLLACLKKLVFTKEAIAKWANKSLCASAEVVTDGLGCFRGVTANGATHERTVTGGGAASVKLEQAGDIIVVNTGEVVPVDGVIAEGMAMIDQHALTGESTPAEKGVGDHVFASTIMVAGKALVSVEQSGGVLAVDVGHRNPQLTVVVAAVTDFHDVRVPEFGGEIGFAGEPLPETRIRG